MSLHFGVRQEDQIERTSKRKDKFVVLKNGYYRRLPYSDSSINVSIMGELRNHCLRLELLSICVTHGAVFPSDRASALPTLRRDILVFPDTVTTIFLKEHMENVGVFVGWLIPDSGNVASRGDA